MTKRFNLPFRYPGGKHYAIGTLRQFWQDIPYEEYREPFVGGGSVFFNKNKADVNWLNDLDEELMTTYKTLHDEKLRMRLVEKMNKEVASKERWKEIFNMKPADDFGTAFKYYYLNRTSFSGKLVSAAWGYRPKRSLPPSRWHERIIPSGEKLKNVRLTSMDFENVISAPSQNRVLIYVDPPYFNPPKHKHYRQGFDLADHIRLCETLKKTKHKFFLTYDNNEMIKDMYKWADVYDLKFYYRVGNSHSNNGSRKLGFELVICNYGLPKQSELFGTQAVL